MEYIKASSRNRSYKGDKGTWAGIKTENGKRYFVAKRARHGIITAAYEEEMNEICKGYGVDFSSINSGDSVTVECPS